MTSGMILWRIGRLGRARFAANYTKAELREFYKTVVGDYPSPSMSAEDVSHLLFTVRFNQIRGDAFRKERRLGHQTMSNIQEAVLKIMTLSDTEIISDLGLLESLYIGLYDSELDSGLEPSVLIKSMREDIPVILELADTLMQEE